jgi:hypothetical protein
LLLGSTIVLGVATGVLAAFLTDWSPAEGSVDVALGDHGGLLSVRGAL